MTAPRQKELEAMDVFELINKLIWDQANASHYRNRLVVLMEIAGTTNIKKLVVDELIVEEPESEPKSDFVAMNIRRKNNGEQVNWIKYIMSSGWDYIDPRRKMFKPPDEVEGFLRDKVDKNDINYQDMTSSEQRYMNTVSDSFISWLRTRG